MYAVQGYPVRQGISIQEEWNHALSEENRVQYPNRELVTHTHYWFHVVNNNQWPEWITENTRDALVHAATLPTANAVEDFRAAVYPHLHAVDLLSLYRLLNSHNRDGDRSKMIEGGALAAALVQDLERYITIDLVEVNPVLAGELSQILTNYDPGANIAHLLPALNQNLERHQREQEEISGLLRSMQEDVAGRRPQAGSSSRQATSGVVQQGHAPAAALEEMVAEMTREQERLQRLLEDQGRVLIQTREALARVELRAGQSEEAYRSLDTDAARERRTLEARLEELSRQVPELIAETERLREAIGQAEEDHRNMSSQLQRFGNNPDAVAEALRQVSEYRSLSQKLRAANEEIDTLREQLLANAEKERADGLEVKNQTLLTQIDALRQNLRELQASSSEKIATLTDQVSRLSTQLKEQQLRSQTDIRAQKERNASLESEIAKLYLAPPNENRNLTQEKFDQMQALLKKAQADLQTLKNANREAVQGKQKFMDENERLRLVNADLVKENKRLMEALKKATSS